MSTQSSKMKVPAHPENHDANRDPITGAPGAHPVGSGVGAAGGAAGGAAVGGAVGGPVGAVVGAVVGGVAGGLAGKGVAESVNPTAEEAYWKENYSKSHSYQNGRPYTDYQPAYRTGYMGYGRYGAGSKKFEDVEPQLRGEYESSRGQSSLGWDQARGSAREAWDRVQGGATVAGSGVGSAANARANMSSKSLAMLNSFLRGELSAVGTYKQALSRLSSSVHAQKLTDALNSHMRRVEALKQHIRQDGGDPSDSSGVWGAFAKLYEGGAAMFGEKAAINALESGEDHGIDDFKRGLHKLAPMCLEFMQREILPEQERTHRMIADLKHSLA